MPIRKSTQANTEVATMATGGTPSGFTYLGFARGGVDAEQDFLTEVSAVSGATTAQTVRIVQYDSNGTVKNDITTPSSGTLTIGKAYDCTTSSNTVNTGVNFPWPLTAGDSVLVTAVSAGSANVTFTFYPKGV